MLTKKQLEIFAIFNKNVFREYTFNKLKKIAKQNSNSIIQNAIKAFKEENLINERQIGNIKLYSLNHNNDRIYNYLILTIKLPKQIQKAVEILKQEIEKYTLFYSLVLFGSHADSSYRKNSDLDIAIIIPNKDKNIKIAVNSAENIIIPELDAHIILRKEFLEMLKQDSPNLGKEIVRNNVVVYNNAYFYKLVLLGIKNGFKITDYEVRK